MSQFQLDAKHHAVMFGCLVRNTLKHLGDEIGAAAVKEAVVLYGKQRGTRMAMRAKAAGFPLTMSAYNTLREWKVLSDADAHKSAPYAGDADYKVSVSVACPWHSAWKEYGMEAEGLYYCSDVDAAILNGFNSSLTLKVEKLLTKGDGCCEMHWLDDTASAEQVDASSAAKVLPWGYHVCHLYCSFISVLSKYAQCKDVLADAKAQFTGLFGENSLDEMAPYMTYNFASLPKEG
ncbi:MAG: hypothetical protein E7328_03405 [Clostridiales bacterium]|nr:hypothetical protein [Clostridiales bacterium]